MEAADMDRERKKREDPPNGASDGPRPDTRGRGIEARPRNWLVPVILLTLREWNSYGYELMERATAFGFEAMNPGTLYRTLRQMEKDGIVESTWETSKGGPARRMYTITASGESYLDFWARSLEQYQRNMDTFFRLYTGFPLRPEANRPEGDPPAGGGEDAEGNGKKK
jgi:poly-beta-hydroxybutyrate-responsive repressor